MKIAAFISQLHHQQKPFACLIGAKTDYSLSPRMHNTAAKHHDLEFEYFALDVTENEMPLVRQILEHSLCKGINITIPYKETILDWVDEQNDLVKSLKAANVVYKKDGKLCATNTDVAGFCYPLSELSVLESLTHAFVFGSGGASRAAVEGLKQLGLPHIFIVSRNPDGKENQLSYENWTDYLPKTKTVLLVNGSPLGMTTMPDLSPIEKELVRKINPLVCYDLIYNPSETKFLREAKQVGVPFVINGLEMLIKQGSDAFQLWNGVSFPIEKIKALLENH